MLDDDGNVVKADEYRAQQNVPVPKTPKPPCDWSVHAQPMLEAAPLLPIVALNLDRAADLMPARDLRVLRAEVLGPSARGPPAA
ncbi:hypothetical protein [Paracoccus sp. PAR01]|uniref:hypothetical protein n=1 Tax=Paracoccus sp. PAR01 TaxID=2769282 RepID=UPI001781B2A8|nr:hypothetical protein [Paracoccus sp. PAR01]MBD9529776.1 hypothetical protein [Paracoccus sp. PAR01]